MRILFVAPVLPGMPQLQIGAEMSRVASGNQISICDGTVDRTKLESYLKSDTTYEIIHFAQHGQRMGLELSDGILEVSDLASMLNKQTKIKLLFINACQSIATGIELHNVFHIPCVAHDALINDGAAVAFAETFYRALGSGLDIATAFERGMRTLQVRFPGDAHTPQLINGDMADRAFIQDLRQDMLEAFDHFNLRMDKLEETVNALSNGRNWRLQLAIIGLLAALVVAQILTPVLNSILIHLP